MESAFYRESTESWEKFCNEAGSVTFFYIPLWRKYSLKYSRYLVEDLSFTVLHDNAPVAIVPLFLENDNGILQFSDGGNFLRAPIIRQDIGIHQFKKAEVFLMNEVNRLAMKHGVGKYMAAIDAVRGKEIWEAHNWLMRYGFLDVSLNTQIVDLRRDMASLHQDLRKRYTSYINKADKVYQCFIWDSTNEDFAMHEQYRLLHHKAAGRITRPLETFSIQYELLKQGYAALIGVKYKEHWIAFSYFNNHDGLVYYSSASDDPDVKDLPCPLSHAILWKAILYYKDKGARYLETGLQQFSPQIFDYPSEKDCTISLFKKGLGGGTFTHYRGIKYYTSEALRLDLEKIPTQLEKALFNRKDV